MFHYLVSSINMERSELQENPRMDHGTTLDVPPSFFICPISLEIMKDPVTISTGMTFDRESIQKWLFSCQKITCPITKQPLSDFSLTPNSNLLRLIQSWPAHMQNASSSSTTKFVEVQKPEHDDSLEVLLEEIKQPQLQVKSLRKIRSLIQANRQGYIRDCLGDLDNSLFSVVASIVVKSTDLPAAAGITEQITCCNDTSSTIIDEAMALLCLLRPSNESLKAVAEGENGLLITSLCSIMIQSCLSNLQIRIEASLVLRSIFKIVDEIYKEGIRVEFFESITEILKDQNSKNGSMAVLAILMEVLPCGKNKEKAIKGGFIPILVEVLAETNEPHACEMMLVVIEKLCQKAEGRAAFLAHPVGMAAVLSKILKVSHIGNYKAISLLSCVFRFCKSGEVAREFMEVGGVTKICMVLQSGCSSKTKDKAREILGFHLETWKESPCFPSSFKA